MLVFGIISLLPARAFFMLKFYILVSSNTGAILRHFSSHYSGLTPNDAEVIINTLDEDFLRDAVELCKILGVTYHITESNGTPAKGKNELLKHFLKTDHKYCVQIDGDDYLTPHGVWLYKEIAAGNKVPDAICLKNQISLSIEGKMFDTATKVIRKFFTITKGGPDYEKMYENMLERFIPEEKARDFVGYHKVYYAQQEKFCEDQDAHCRVTFFSRKAAEIRFPEDFVVGEDTLHYYKLKHEHMQGNLTFVCNDEAPATYIYNQLDGQGTVWRISKGFNDWEWMNTFNEKVKEYEEKGMLYEKDLPLLKINYKDQYVAEDLNTAGLVRYETDTHYVSLPANATKESILNALQKHGISLEK